MDGWNRWFKRWLPGGGARGDGAADDAESVAGDGDRARRNRLLLMLVGLGVLLLLLSRLDGPGFPDPPDRGAPPASAAPFSSEEELERRLEALLSRIAGAGTVEVFLTFETSERHHYALQRSETERRGYEADGAGDWHLAEHETDRSVQPVLLRDEQGRGERALVEWIEAPAVRGVLVVASGAADPSVRYRLLQAVETALGIPSHRIEVLPRAR